MGAQAAEPEVPAPPTTFRCNRKRMVMIVRVTLHHVSPAQIHLETTPTGINLSTSGRRRYQMSRAYPRGIECDDTQTTANMEGNVLVIEMPITNLPPVEPHGYTPAQPAADTQKPPKKRKAEEARGAAASAPVPRAGRAAGSGSASRKTSASAPSGSSLLELADEATAEAAARHEQGLSKMRKMQRAETDRSEKLAERKHKKEAQKQQLLEALRKHKKETKKVAKKERAESKAATPSGGSGRRVSFA